MKTRNNKIKISCISFLLTLMCSLAFCILFDIAPFGTRSFAAADGNIQYLDFFAYFKDVLAGKNSLVYTFSSTLGSDTFGIFTYYLSSPFNLLLIFFEKSQLSIFFNITVVLKISLAACTMSVFLCNRFSTRLRPVYTVMLSLSYAFMQYNIAQADNIMWLDGVYMLPLIILGVYQVVRYKKMIPLCLSAGLAILFNWYAAGMCCLLSIIWFAVEYALKCVDDNEHFSLQDCIKTLVRYGFSMVIALFISAALFLPTIISMLGGKGVAPDFSNFFIGNLLNVIDAWKLGENSAYGYPALFCGSITLIGTISVFTTKGIDKRSKIILGSLLLVMLMSVYWNPLYMTFSLLRPIYSYYIRHAFTIIFVLIFIAAYFFASTTRNKEIYIFQSALAFSGILLFSAHIQGITDLQKTYYTAIFVIITAVLLIIMSKRRYVAVVTVSFLILELGFNAKLLLITQNQAVDNVAYNSQYMTEQQKQIDAIKEFDKDFYRISYTSRRTDASYNDALAYNFASISSYTSCSDSTQMEFLDKLGYRTESGVITLVNTSLLGADSLLGVKYLISPESINGLKELSEVTGYNGNNIYENPYALPMTYVLDDFKSKKYTNENSFEFQNELYSQLLGEDIAIYQKLAVKKVKTDDGFVYTFDIPQGNYTVYADLNIHGKADGITVQVGDKENFAYGCWLAPDVFYVPSDEKQVQKITVNTNRPDLFGEPYIYALNLDKLSDASTEISKSAVNTIKYNGNKINGTVNVENDKYVVLAVPYSDNWNFKINGKKAEALKFADNLTVLPLESGSNEISAQYDVPLLRLGTFLTILGFIIVILIALYSYTKLYLKKKKSEKSKASRRIL